MALSLVRDAYSSPILTEIGEGWARFSVRIAEIGWAITQTEPQASLRTSRDEDLMVLYREGHGGAFDEIFRRHARPLFGMFLRRGCTESDANDLVQQTFFRLHQACQDYRQSEPLKPWLYTIALNLLRDLIRKRSTARRWLDEVEGQKEFDPSALPIESVRAVRTAVLQLPEAQREVLILHFYEHFTFREIANMLSLGESAVRVRAHRAYRQLRTFLNTEEKAAHGLP